MSSILKTIKPENTQSPAHWGKKDKTVKICARREPKLQMPEAEQLQSSKISIYVSQQQTREDSHSEKEAVVNPSQTNPAVQKEAWFRAQIDWKQKKD